MIRPESSFVSVGLPAVLSLIALLCLAPAAVAQDEKKLTNDKVLTMIKADLPESTVILAIEADPSALDTSADSLIKMKEGGASKAVLDAMVTAKHKKPEAAALTQATLLTESAHFSEVVLVNGDTRTKLMQGGEMKVSAPLFGLSAKMRQVFRGARSPARVKSGPITFEFSLMSNKRPEETVLLVRPELKKDERRIETSRTGGFLVMSTSSGKKELVPVKYEKMGEANSLGTKYRLTPETGLEPGEYVLMANHQFFDFGIDP